MGGGCCLQFALSSAWKVAVCYVFLCAWLGWSFQISASCLLVFPTAFFLFISAVPSSLCMYPQVKASDTSLLSGYLHMTCDKKVWQKRYFAVHDTFVLYSFKAHQVGILHFWLLLVPLFTSEVVKMSNVDFSGSTWTSKKLTFKWNLLQITAFIFRGRKLQIHPAVKCYIFLIPAVFYYLIFYF